MMRRRRYLDRALIAGTVIMAAASLAMLVSAITLVRDASQSFRGNLTFYASQVEYEVMQLIDYVDRFEHGDEDVTLDDVLTRYDILWSRVNLRTSSGTLNGEALGIPEAVEVMENTRRLLVELEPLVLALNQQDRTGHEQLKDRLREVVPVAHALALLAKDERARRNTHFLESQLRQANYTFVFIIGMFLFGVLSVARLIGDRREISRMNAQLEDRVAARTRDLEATNARLAEEVEERERNKVIAAEREARLAQAAQLAKLGYYVWDAVERRVEFCSDQHAEAHGLSAEEYIARMAGTRLDSTLIHPDDAEKLEAAMAQLDAGEMVEIDYRVVTDNGIRRLREVARPVTDAGGRVVRHIGSTLDMTDQYETEMKLFEAQRMDSIGKLSGGVAHDFNNLLAVILGNLELLKEIDDEEIQAEMIEDAIKSTLRGRDLTLNMLSFARRAPVAPTELDLNSVVGGMEPLLRRAMPENIDLNISVDDDLWTVVADQSLTESSLLNLALNARDAMENGGQLTIETSNVRLDSDYMEQRGEEIEPGNYVMLAVTDTGAGIDPHVLPNVFEPFFTTKSVGKNSGLGLSMVQGFVKQTGGAVSVYSEPGVGTTFKLFFQAASVPEQVAADAPQEPAKPARSARILLVEDDPTVRKVLSSQLERSGYSVISAGESDSAQAAFQSSGPFDLVVSDIVMPGELQGPALARKLRQLKSDLPVIFLSGYPQEASINGKGLDEDDVMLMKPVSRVDLLNAINNALTTQPERA